MKEPVYLIDGYGLIYRAYFVHFKNPLRNPKGENTSAIYGFLLSLNKIIKIKNPSYIGVILDSTTPTFRHEQYADYKITRDKAPFDLHNQIPRIERILKASGISCLRHNGFEADDIIATVAKVCKEEGRGCYIISKDKDLLQLVDETVKIINLEKGFQDFTEWGRDEVFRYKGIYPEQVVDFLSLAGDASDNIPGVLGIGEKTALKLIARFNTIDEIYKRIDEVGSKSQRQKLIDGKESAFMSRKLIALRTDVPFKGTEIFRREAEDRDSIIRLYQEEGFNSLIKDMGQDIEVGELDRTEHGRYPVVIDKEQLDMWLERVKQEGIFSFDIETDNLDAIKAEPIGFSLSVRKGEACYIPIKASGTEVIKIDYIRNFLKILLEDPALKLIGQNIKYDYKVLKRWGIEIKNIYFDTMIAAWILDSTKGRYNMDFLADKYLGFKTIKYKDLILPGEEKTLLDIDINIVADYAGEDADITYQLYLIFMEDLNRKGNEKLKNLFFDIEMPLVYILGDMELAGIKLEAGQLEMYRIELDKMLTELEKSIYKECGHTFNIRSTKELQKVLFEERQNPCIKKTKTGYSTDSQVLKELETGDVVAGKILRHRMLSKLKSTYVDTLPDQINPGTGRLHTSFMQTGTATGRLSSIEPNLQNIPIRDEEGRRIRAAFIAEEGYIFLSADYSQIELVVLAHLSEDEKLIRAFKDNKDIHSHTASLIFHIKENDVTPYQRRIGKTINFGVIYGMSSFRLARDYKMPKADAEKFINTYFTEYAGVNKFRNDIIKKAEELGYVETIMGRRRKLDNIVNSNKTVKMAEERIALNTPIQGSASDIVKCAMLKLSEKIKQQKLKASFILQVHDEILLEVMEEEAGLVEKTVKQIMENVVRLKVPLNVTIQRGKSWGDIH